MEDISSAIQINATGRVWISILVGGKNWTLHTLAEKIIQNFKYEFYYTNVKFYYMYMYGFTVIVTRTKNIKLPICNSGNYSKWNISITGLVDCLQDCTRTYIVWL